VLSNYNDIKKNNNVILYRGGKGEGFLQRISVERKKTQKYQIQARTCEISFPFSPLYII
jgi:hypothetical protein